MKDEMIIESVRELKEGNECIEIPLEYAKNVLKVLDNHESLGYAIMSHEIKEIVSSEAYEKLMGLYMKYHNANCGPFNRTLKYIIKAHELKKDS